MLLLKECIIMYVFCFNCVGPSIAPIESTLHEPLLD